MSHHKKLCVQLKRAERKVLQNALKYATTSKNRVTGLRLETDKNCDEKTEESNSNGDGEDKGRTDGMDDTTAAVNQLGIQAD